ncbi:MAG: protein-export chaperone SecB [Alphaproteobacteria bacterium]|nr:MAG: protein-export chaperone SecB [Alphaproteobacteria bacterium]
MSQNTIQPKFDVNVIGQYTKDFSFENPCILTHFSNPEKPEISVDIQVQAQQANEEVYEVELHVQATAKSKQETLFIVDLRYAGLFKIGTENSEDIKPFLLIECPRMLFPFARSIVANATSDGGYLPLMLNPVNFSDLYQQQDSTASQPTMN